MTSDSSSGSTFAIADVHGCDEELRALLKVLPLTRDSLVVFLGDYIDRGPSPSGVVDTILELREYCQVVCLVGNHEVMLREFLDGSDPRRQARFIYNGGGATLASYSNEDGVFVIPEEHLEFFAGLQYFHVAGEHCFVHAGLPVDVEEIDVRLHGEEMVWMRARPGMQWPRRSKIVVHGHTPVHDVDIDERRINLDTSCVYGHRLTAMEVETRKVWQIDRIPQSTPTPAYLRDTRDSRREALRFTGRVPVSVKHDGATLAFETINYSELGVLMHPAGAAGAKRRVRITPGTIITGQIGAGEGAVPFRGVVLRVDDGDRHAVKLLPT